MPFARPTLADLIARILGDFLGRLEIDGSTVLRRAMAKIASAVWGGAVHVLHGHLDWVSEQLFVDTAERAYLLRIGTMYGISPIAATFASGTATATGSNGSVIPINTILIHANGQTYKTTAEVTIASGTATMPLIALVAGEDGNLEAGQTITFQTPISGVNSNATVVGISGGNDEEGTESLRERVLLRFREPPEGGAAHDYIAWAREVAGVTRVWVYPNEDGLGTVVVRFVRDNDSGSIIPDSGEVTAVQTKLNEERPVTAVVVVEAPTTSAVAFTIAVVPNTQAVKDAVTAELDDLFTRDAAPGDGITSLGTIYISAIRTAIGIAEGLTDYTLTVPSANQVPAVGQLLTRGTITWA